MTPIRKAVLNPFEKAPKDGEPLQMVVARKEVMDLDGDIFYSYKWKEAGCLMSPWGHNMRDVPVAAGQLTERKDGAIIFEPEFFEENSDTERALRAAYKIVEFSYAFFPEKYEIVWSEDREPWGWGYNFYDAEIYEVSPVDKGSSFDTGIGKASELPEWRKTLRDAAADPKAQQKESANLLADIVKCRLVTIGG